MGGIGGGQVQRVVRQRPRRPVGVRRWICLLGFILVALVGFAGCGSGRGGEQGAQALSLSLQLPSQVRAGETVALTLIAKNVSDAPVELGLGGREDTGFAGSYDFVVSTPDGVEVWSFTGGKVFEAILSVKDLSPGAQLTLVGEWNQADAQGTPVVAGSYVVRGFLSIRLDVSTPGERGLTLETEAKSLVILPK